MDADQVKELRELAGKAPRLKWSVDWNSLCIVLASDGSGAFIAKTTSPSAAAFIAAASPDVVAQLAAEWEARGEKLARAVYLAEHLWQMIPQGVWREHGAEWMGQYEGDYHAEKVRDELATLAVSSSTPTTQEAE
jgi:hypothetical protein